MKGSAYSQDVYQREDDCFADIAAAYRAELKILYQHSTRNIQFDDSNSACKFLFGFLSRLCPPAHVLQTSAPKKMIAGWKVDPLKAYSLDELLGKYIALYNSCISRHPHRHRPVS
jgi:hypothetical protein